jgi:hypothetical protein
MNAEEGQFFVDVTGNASRPPTEYGEVAQTVATQPGQEYQLSFWVGSSSQYPPKAPHHTPADIRIEVTVDGSSPTPIVDKQPFPAPAKELNEWDLHQFDFTAGSGTTTITFSANGTTGDDGHGGDYVGLDNVSLQAVCSIFDLSHCGTERCDPTP